MIWIGSNHERRAGPSMANGSADSCRHCIPGCFAKSLRDCSPKTRHNRSGGVNRGFSGWARRLERSEHEPSLRHLAGTYNVLLLPGEWVAKSFANGLQRIINAVIERRR
jgi:hypothetical protein